MPATMLIRELNGAGPTATDKTLGTIRFRNSDSAAVDTANPLVVPTTQTEYSFRKVLRLQISAGTFTEVSNLNFYMDGANGFGSGRKLWANTTAQATYVQGTKPSVASDPPVLTGLTGTGATDAFTYTSGAPKDMDSANAGPFTPTSGGTPAGSVPKEIGDFLNLVAELEVGASQGVWPGEPGTWSWDEI
jgi:hypothetical protein